MLKKIRTLQVWILVLYKIDKRISPAIKFSKLLKNCSFRTLVGDLNFSRVLRLFRRLTRPVMMNYYICYWFKSGLAWEIWTDRWHPTYITTWSHPSVIQKSSYLLTLSFFRGLDWLIIGLLQTRRECQNYKMLRLYSYAS